MNPFIKWAGGKRWLVADHAHLIPSPAPGCSYYEPFLGGGAVFFGTFAMHPRTFLSDVNLRLVDTYRAVRDHVDDLILELQMHPHSAEHYYRVRELLNTQPDAPLVKRAARFIVINKFGFNGMYRENRNGGCNIPFGRAVNPSLYDEDSLRECSAALQGVSLQCGVFVLSLADVKEGDAVFLDPPYVPASKSANFTGYSADGFTEKDQADLVQELHRLDDIGARRTLTNSEAARWMYQGWEITSVTAKRSIAANGKKRADAGEIIVRGKWRSAVAEAA